MARAAGFRLKVRGTVPSSGPGQVVVSNHLTYWDPVVLRAALGLQPQPATLVWYRVNALTQNVARPVLPVRETGKNLSLLREMKRHLQTGNLLVFPEATVTDGLGVLEFDRSAFSLGAPVCVCALRYRRALPFFRPTALRERLLVEAWMDLLQPWVDVDVVVLGTWERQPDEDGGAFALRCQRAIAEALGVPATRHSWRDRRHLLRDLGREVIHVPQ
jgi:1-acyl-sn-glycerol-3-phosphate acyltransferase